MPTNPKTGKYEVNLWWYVPILLLAVIPACVWRTPPTALAPAQTANGAYMQGQRDAQAGRQMTGAMMVGQNMTAAERANYVQGHDRAKYDAKR